MSKRPRNAARLELALCVMLSAMLGGLAGALSFASDNRPMIDDLRAWLSEGKPVVLVEAERGHEETLRSLGATRVDKLG